MNFEAVMLLMAAGSVVPALVLFLAHRAGMLVRAVADHADRRILTGEAVFLALLAGPALFARAVWLGVRSGGVGALDLALGALITCGWCCCYGIVVVGTVTLIA